MEAAFELDLDNGVDIMLVRLYYHKEPKRMAGIQRITNKRLGEILTHGGLVTPEQLEEVLQIQKKSGGLLGEMLVDRNYLTERDVAQAIATQFGVPYLSPKQYYTSAAVAKMIPVEVMKKHLLVPLDRMGDVLTICLGGPVEPEVLETIEKSTGCVVQIFVAIARDIRETIEKIAKDNA